MEVYCRYVGGIGDVLKTWGMRRKLAQILAGRFWTQNAGYSRGSSDLPARLFISAILSSVIRMISLAALFMSDSAVLPRSLVCSIDKARFVFSTMLRMQFSICRKERLRQPRSSGTVRVAVDLRCLCSSIPRPRSGRLSRGRRCSPGRGILHRRGGAAEPRGSRCSAGENSNLVAWC